MSEAPATKEACAICQMAKTYAVPLVIIVVLIGVYYWKKKQASDAESK